MLKNQLKHLNDQELQLTNSYQSLLKWIGSRASGHHLLQISENPGVLSLINQDGNLDLVNVIHSQNKDITFNTPLLEDCESTFWVGDITCDIPYPKCYFETIIIDNTLALLEETTVFEMVKKLLKPNGKIIISQTITANIPPENQWTELFKNFKELDKRVVSDSISWVGRNVRVEEFEEQRDAFLNELQQKVKDKKLYEEEIIQKFLEQKQERELERQKEDYKLLRCLPLIKKKQNKQIASIDLTAEEKDNLLSNENTVTIQHESINVSQRISAFIRNGQIAIVVGNEGYYHKCSLNFPHQLTNALLNKGYKVIYVTSEKPCEIKPIQNGKKQLLQMDLEDFVESISMFEMPALFLTSPIVSIAKIVGRLQWQRWSIYYLPEVVPEKEINTHKFLMNTLNPDDLNLTVHSQYPVSATEIESLPTYINRSKDSDNVVLGYIGSLSTETIDYDMVKEFLHNNESMTIELIGYHLPRKKPVRSKRLIIREYTHKDEVNKRIEKWNGGILPFHNHSENVSLQVMRGIGIPLLSLIDEEGNKLEENEYSSPRTPNTLSDLMDNLLPSKGGA